MKKLKLILVLVFTASLITFSACQKIDLNEDENDNEPKPNSWVKNEIIINGDIALGALYDSCLVWNANGGMNVEFKGDVIFNDSIPPNAISYVFNSEDGIYYNPLEVGIEEVKSTKTDPVQSANIKLQGIHLAHTNILDPAYRPKNSEINTTTANTVTVDTLGWESAKAARTQGVNFAVTQSTVVDINGAVWTAAETQEFYNENFSNDATYLTTTAPTQLARIIDNDTLSWGVAVNMLNFPEGVPCVTANNVAYIQTGASAGNPPESVLASLLSGPASAFVAPIQFLYADGTPIPEYIYRGETAVALIQEAENDPKLLEQVMALNEEWLRLQVVPIQKAGEHPAYKTIRIR